MTLHKKLRLSAPVSINGRPVQFPRAFADAGMLAVCLTTLTFLAVAAMTRPMALANRAVCSANIRGIIQSMVIYAQSNVQVFPLVMPPWKQHYENAAVGPQHGSGPAQSVIKAFYRSRGAAKGGAVGHGPLAFFRPGKRGLHAGSPLACLWLMVLQNQIVPKSFICPCDPIATQASDQYIKNGNVQADCYSNFGHIGGKPGKSGQGESYSIAFPWVGDNPAPWWTANDGADVPIVSDMAPAMDTREKGKMLWAYRDPTQPMNHPKYKWAYNSGNHGGAGQNVGFGDDHVAWDVNPYCGQNMDNIFTYDSPHQRKPILGGGKTLSTGKSVKVPVVKTLTPPYDIVMVPVRNVATGAW